jgi:hypothetical protein
MPSFSFEEDQFLFEMGSFLKQVNVEPRDIHLQVAFRANHATKLRAIKRSFFSLFNPLNGDGKLRVRAFNGSERELICRYKSGMEGQERRGQTWNFIQLYSLTFRAFDPFWYDVKEVSYSFQLNKIPPKWFPFFPLRLGGESLASEIQINNVGDVEAFPNWTIHGPGKNPKMFNSTTGQMISFTGITLDESQFITIDIKPRGSQIKTNDGTDIYSELDFGSTLWRIAPNNNIIRIEMVGVTSDSKVNLSFRPRYLGV